MKHKIQFLPMNKIVEAEDGDNLLKTAFENDIVLNGSCAGKGNCGKCKILLKGMSGDLTPKEKKLLSEEEREEGYRLACQIDIHSSLIVTLPDYHEGIDRKKRLNQLPGHFIAPKSEGSGGKKQKIYGVAADIGTTTIVLMLWELRQQKLLDTEAITNPQVTNGADVISRITYCMENPNHIKTMQGKVINSMNKMIIIMAKRNGINAQQIEHMTVVGNTTMSHLFLGRNPEGLARYPFAPAFQGGVCVNASALRLFINPLAKVYVLPNIAGHVGSDITGVMLASDVFSLSGNTVIIDIGTNGEIMAASDGKVKVCSTAAGPAFEGTGIQFGMRAAKGAIERVSIKEDVNIKVIGDTVPVGICGSGIIDAVAKLLHAGVITREGNIISPEEAARKEIPKRVAQRIYEGKDYNSGFVLAKNEKEEDIVITQKDIREIQLAKSAILSGIKTLLDKFGIKEREIDRILIAGAFGNYIDKKSAVAIGLLPDIAPDKIISIGNAAGIGASMALLSEDYRKRAENEVEQISHVELSQDVNFQNYYIEGMFFPQSGNNEERP